MYKPYFELIKSDCLRMLSEIKDGQNKLNNLSIPHTAIFLNIFPKTFIVIEEDFEASRRLFQDFLFFRELLHCQRDAVFLPIGSNIDLVGRRIESLRQYLNNPSSSLITSIEAINESVDIFSLDDGLINLHLHSEIPRDALRSWLLKNGYREVSMVIDKGEFSQRSYIFDIFPCTNDEPVRIEFFGDEVDSIRTIDIESQRSVKESSEVTIFSASQRSSTEDLLDQLMTLKQSSLIFASQIKDLSIPSKTPYITIYHRLTGSGVITSSEKTFSDLGIIHQERQSLEVITSSIQAIEKPILFVMQSMAQGERLNDLMKEHGMVLPFVPLDKLSTYDGVMCFTKGTISSGINLDSILIISDKEIFGDRPSLKPTRRQKLSRILINLEDLKIGDYLVHRDYGIGRFKGLTRQNVGDYQSDVIKIEYSNGTLYIPVENLHLIQKHSSSDSQLPIVDAIGSKNWLKRKIKARLGAEEIAKKLIQLYAERSISKGFAFSEDTSIHREFDDFFSYQITPDQLKATEDILKIMQSERPMDMLLCGDVGYGKTEVIMRAVFRAVFDKKQCAILVPTTILAEQHYRTFQSRFSPFNVKIDVLSRFKSVSERNKTLKALAKHEIDVVIGTHSLLRKDITFADLGLLVIDEEQRFGVQQKERLKELKKGVDVITLTATPIPRTLQMSLSGIKEMTIIETPPEDRISVKTFVSTYSNEIIKEAIEREIRRHGQVFYVHNRISNLEEKADKIKNMIHGLRIAIAHAEMPERELEKVMLGFINKEFDVLVSTAIIGAGLDIPSANTIIVDRADLFGLADLYQLRGRVGRSNVQAYAYLLIPDKEKVSEDAMKRLEAIQDLTYLGAGFKIALKDLEIRGAGNILGAEQSGHIGRVGFDMYMEMIEEAVASLKGETVKARFNPEVKLLMSSYIPDEYIGDVTIRMSVYRRLSECKTIEEIKDLRAEMIDRFGALPTVTENLIILLRIKCYARMLFICKVYEVKDRINFYFQDHDLEIYGIPEDFYDRLFVVIKALSKKNRVLGFIDKGFSIKIANDDKIKGLTNCEEVLKKIYEGLRVR